MAFVKRTEPAEADHAGGNGYIKSLRVMKNEDKEFDDFLKSAFEKRKFEQKDRYWTNAQSLIAAQRKSRSKVIMTFMLSSVTLVSLSTALLLWHTGKSSVQANEASQQVPVLRSAAGQNGNNVVTATYTAGANGTGTTNGMPSERLPASSKAAASTSAPASGQTHAAQCSGTTTAKNKAGRDRAARESNPYNTVAANEYTRSSRKQQQGNNPRGKAQHLQQAEAAATRNSAQSFTGINGLRMFSLGSDGPAIDSFGKKEAFLAYVATQQRSFLMAEGGINTYNMNNDLAGSLNFHAGLRYYYFVSPTVALSSGIGYSRVHQDLGTRVYNNIDYSFGQQTSETKITTLRLDYLEIPLSVHYRIKGSHFASAGALAGYAIRSSEYMDRETRTKTSGYMDAIHKFDIQLHLGYNCLLNERYTLSAGYYFGLTDVSDNRAFRSSRMDRNTGFRLTLGYKLL
jgi:cytoskeletal protein RodZ